eukprot:5836298-Amphidinium_carterae.1
MSVGRVSVPTYSFHAASTLLSPVYKWGDLQLCNKVLESCLQKSHCGQELSASFMARQVRLHRTNSVEAVEEPDTIVGTELARMITAVASGKPGPTLHCCGCCIEQVPSEVDIWCCGPTLSVLPAERRHLRVKDAAKATARLCFGMSSVGSAMSSAASLAVYDAVEVSDEQQVPSLVWSVNWTATEMEALCNGPLPGVTRTLSGVARRRLMAHNLPKEADPCLVATHAALRLADSSRLCGLLPDRGDNDYALAGHWSVPCVHRDPLARGPGLFVIQRAL